MRIRLRGLRAVVSVLVTAVLSAHTLPLDGFDAARVDRRLRPTRDVRRSQRAGEATWLDAFDVARAELGPTGRNAYFILEPGYRLVLEHGRERLVMTVLDDTRVVDGVTTRVVEERETNNGQLVEVSRNFLAISAKKDVYYFGEEVDVYRRGRIVNHEGAWLAGAGTARFGLMMPAAPAPGAKYYQEVAPGVAMDRAEVVALDAVVTTPAGRFARAMKIEETTPLEPGVREYKYFVEGIGLVQDGDLKLVSAGMADVSRGGGRAPARRSRGTCG